MADPVQTAERLLQKAEGALDPLAREMKVMRWPPEFRAILWDAVARRAALLAAEADAEHKSLNFS